jgi:hypothetical protein
MKKIAVLFIVFSSFAAYAGKYYDATVLFTDGKSKTGLVESPFGGDYISFKSSNHAPVEKLESFAIKGITFTIDNEKREFHQLKIYLGWGQKRISDAPSWLRVVEKGAATLYMIGTTMQGSIYNSKATAGFEDFYCIRDGEPAAKLVAQVSTMNNNQTFRAKAPLYFADYPELAARIKSKEYTWKDLTTVVQEYNKWASTKR